MVRTLHSHCWGPLGSIPGRGIKIPTSCPKTKPGTCLVVQWLRFHAGNTGDPGSLVGNQYSMYHEVWQKIFKNNKNWKNCKMKRGFPVGSDSKESACKEDPSLIPGSGWSPGGGNGNPFQNSCLENPMDRGAWQATVHVVANSRTWLSN